MTKPSITKRQFLSDFQVLHWVNRRQLEVFYFGKLRRRWILEKLLPEMVARGRLKKAKRPGDRHIYYSAPRKANKSLHKIDHGIACSEIYIRLMRARGGVGIPEKRFYPNPTIPEFGILYTHGVLLMAEFCSKDNFYRRERLIKKLEAYQQNMWRMAGAFNAKPVVLFVISEKRDRLCEFVKKYKYPVWLCDWESFVNVPIGKALDAPIYIWGEDGKEECLNAGPS